MLIDLLRPIDDLDSRREIWHALSKLDAVQRIEFLEWSVKRVNQGVEPFGDLVVITSATGEFAETFYDLMLLICQRNLDVPTVLRELERRAGMKTISRGV